MTNMRKVNSNSSIQKLKEFIAVEDNSDVEPWKFSSDQPINIFVQPSQVHSKSRLNSPKEEKARLERQNNLLTSINISDVDLIQLYRDSKLLDQRTQLLDNINKWENFRQKKKDTILRYVDLIKVTRRFTKFLKFVFLN